MPDARGSNQICSLVKNGKRAHDLRNGRRPTFLVPGLKVGNLEAARAGRKFCKMGFPLEVYDPSRARMDSNIG